MRRGLRLMLEQVPEFEVVAEMGDAREALSAAEEAGAGVLVLDLNMPGEPLQVLAEAGGLCPELAVIVLTMEQDPQFARRALDAGAKGYVLKRAAGEELVEAIRAVATGRTYLSRGLQAALAKPAEGGGPGDLSARETEVLALIARGHTNAEIAAELGLSVRTIETHRTRIQQKLSTSSRHELVRYALDHELI